VPVCSEPSLTACRSAGLDGGMGRQDKDPVYESRLFGEGRSREERLTTHRGIILFTMHDDSLGQSLARAVGVDKVLGKPDGMTRLTESIAELLGRASNSISGC
jgi:hypothetical protein